MAEAKVPADTRGSVLLEVEKPKKVCGFPVSKKCKVFVKYVLPSLAVLISDVFDIVSDVMVAVRHYEDGNNLYFGLTLTFLLIPSLAFYIIAINTLVQNPFPNFTQRIRKFIFYTFTLGIGLMTIWPIGNSIQLVCYAFKALLDRNMRTEYIRSWILVRQEVWKWGIMKAFLEDAPQMVLQLYILLSNPAESQSTITVTVQIVSCVISLISMSEAVLNFLPTLKPTEEKDVASEERSGFCIAVWKQLQSLASLLWWFCSIAARVIALTLFASVFHYWVVVLCFGHSAIMVAWILYHQPKRTMAKFFITLFVAFMYNFCFMDYQVDFQQTAMWKKYAFYYVIVICQNTALVLCSYFAADEPHTYYFPLAITHFVLMSCDTLFMLLYLHISKRKTSKMKIQEADRRPSELQEVDELEL